MRYTKYFAGFALAAGMMLSGASVLSAADWRDSYQGGQEFRREDKLWTSCAPMSTATASVSGETGATADTKQPAAIARIWSATSAHWTATAGAGNRRCLPGSTIRSLQ